MLEVPSTSMRGLVHGEAQEVVGDAARPSRGAMVSVSDFDRALALAREGHQEGYTALWTMFSARVAGFVRGRGHLDDVDEVTSQVFLEAFAGLQRFSGDQEGFVALLLTMARRRTVDAHRRRQRARRGEDATVAAPPGLDSFEQQPVGESAEASVLQRESRREVLHWLSMLPADQRDVLLLRVLGDLTIETIALELGKTPGAVKALQRRGLARLRRHMSQSPGVPHVPPAARTRKERVEDA